MKITVVCSESTHPVYAYLAEWINENRKAHEISFICRLSDLKGGDILFLVSCSDIVRANERGLYKSCLVLHASDLPQGRGWSPHVWEIMGGAEKITVSLLEAEDEVDSGKVWKKITRPIPKHALWNEINDILFAAEIELINFAINNFEKIKPQAQISSVEATYYRRRKPKDSLINPELSIADQFDLIRVCDSERYPAYFEMYGQRFKLTLEKINEQSDNN